MKKSLVALAALAATTAFAQSSVTLSGRASMDVSTYEAKGATTASQDIGNRIRVADTASRITFAANEDLGGGLKAGVYCETGVNIDNASSTGQADTNNGNTTTWCSREGRAYIGNAMGEIRLGRQNVWWTQGALNEAGSTFIGSDTLTNLINGGVGVYTVRGENMVKLVAGAGMGAFAGSEVYAGYMGMSGNAGTTNANGEAYGAGATQKGKYNGFKLQYTQGAIVGMIDYQNSTSSPAATAAAAIAANVNAPAYAGARGASSFDRTAIKYGLAYKYNPTSTIALQMWNKKRTDVSSAANTFTSPFGLAIGSTNKGDAQDKGYGVYLKHDIGSNMLVHAQWAKAGNFTNTSSGEVANTGATAYSLGLTKAMSKRTHLYTAYHQINNDSAAAYDMTGGNYTSAGAAGVGVGAKVKMMALGMIHNF